MAVKIGARAARVFVIVAIVRGVAVTPSKPDDRSRVIRIAVIVAAIVRRNRGTATPAAPTTIHAAPGGFGRNGS